MAGEEGDHETHGETSLIDLDRKLHVTLTSGLILDRGPHAVREYTVQTCRWEEDHWVVIGTSSIDIDAGAGLVDVARLVLFLDPDAGAIIIAGQLGVTATFVHDRENWLDEPRRDQDRYRVPPVSITAN